MGLGRILPPEGLYTLSFLGCTTDADGERVPHLLQTEPVATKLPIQRRLWQHTVHSYAAWAGILNLRSTVNVWKWLGKFCMVEGDDPNKGCFPHRLAWRCTRRWATRMETTQRPKASAAPRGSSELIGADHVAPCGTRFSRPKGVVHEAQLHPYKRHGGNHVCHRLRRSCWLQNLRRSRTPCPWTHSVHSDLRCPSSGPTQRRVIK